MTTPTQIAPCAVCKKQAGWWSPLYRISMVFYNQSGDATEQRLHVNHTKKYCANCDHRLTKKEVA